MKIIESSFSIEATTPNLMEVIEKAGRVCYRSEANGDPDTFVRNLIKRGHLSVIEHASVTVRLIVDRGVSHELVRHRLASFSQESTRYCDYAKDDIEFIEPQGLDTELKKLTWRSAMAKAEDHYKEMRAHGCSPQVARSVLPNATASTIFMTCNAREWRHVFQLRASKAAHPDICAILSNGLNKFCEEWPALFEDINQEEAK